MARRASFAGPFQAGQGSPAEWASGPSGRSAAHLAAWATPSANDMSFLPRNTEENLVHRYKSTAGAAANPSAPKSSSTGDVIVTNTKTLSFQYLYECVRIKEKCEEFTDSANSSTESKRKSL